MNARLAKDRADGAKLLSELQDTLAHGPLVRRVETLRRVTDLFIHGAVDYSDAQIAVFDDVFALLVRYIKDDARIILAKRLAPLQKAPPQIIAHLAFHDLIEVAAPVLSQSTMLDDDALIRNARSKSQQHMLAISKRAQLSDAVTEVLIEIGDETVIGSIVNNSGAAMSDTGYARLAARVEVEDALAALCRKASSIPRHHLLRLIAKASEQVRAQLEAAHPDAASQVAGAVNDAGRRMRVSRAAMSEETVIAHDLVRSLYEDGRLDEVVIAGFAEQQKFDETTAALACLAKVSVAVAEAMMVEARAEGVLILAKVSGLSWSTVEAVIHMRDHAAGLSSEGLAGCRATFEQLRVTTAQQVLRFHRMQQDASKDHPQTPAAGLGFA